MAFTDEQEEILVICSFVLSLLSLIFSMTVVLYYIMFRGLRKEAFKLVVFTAISDGTRCVGNLMGSPKEGAICDMQAFLKTFGGVGSMCWVGCMAYTIHLLSSRKLAEVNPKALLRKYHCICWPLATISAVLPLAFGVYKPTGGWCWISRYDEGEVLRWTSFYGILWLMFVWISYVYISLWSYMRGYSKQDEEVREINRLWVYPLIVLFCFGPASVRRVWEQFDDPPYIFGLMHICFSSLHGTLNALAYGRNEDVRILNSRLLDFGCGSCLGMRKVEERGSTIRVWRHKNPSEVDRAIVAHKASISRNSEVGVKEVLSRPGSAKTLSPAASSKNIEMVLSVEPTEMKDKAAAQEEEVDNKVSDNDNKIIV